MSSKNPLQNPKSRFKRLIMLNTFSKLSKPFEDEKSAFFTSYLKQGNGDYLLSVIAADEDIKLQFTFLPSK